MSEERVVDLRSYFPKFERKLTWIDGTEYSIREIDDLSEAEFTSMLEEEQRFDQMSFDDRKAALKRHLQSMLVVPLKVRASAAVGERTLQAEGEPLLVPGDVVYLASGLYVERNVIGDGGNAAGGVVQMKVVEPWRFGAVAVSSRLYRAIRAEALSDPNLSQKQLMVAVASVKFPPQTDADPPRAASGSIS